MKKILSLVFWLCTLAVAFNAPFAFAAPAPQRSVADVKYDVINRLEHDGYLSEKWASEARAKYVTEADKASATSNGSSAPDTAQATKRPIFSWSNFAKVMAVIFFLVGFYGILKKIAAGLWHLIVKVPQELHQAVIFSASLYGLLFARTVWPADAFYVALFSAFSTLFVVGWVLATHEKLEKFLASLFNLGVPIGCVVSFWGMVYFGALAVGYQSKIFGFFAAVCLSGVFTFGLTYGKGVLTLRFDEKFLAPVVFGHAAVLSAYALVRNAHPNMTYLSYFSPGIEYYATIALGTGLLCGSFPFGRNKTGRLYGFLMVVAFATAMTGYYFLDLTVVGSIMACFFALFLLEWLGYWGFKGGVIVGSLVIGVALYSAALVLEHFSQYLIFAAA